MSPTGWNYDLDPKVAKAAPGVHDRFENLIYQNGQYRVRPGPLQFSSPSFEDQEMSLDPLKWAPVYVSNDTILNVVARDNPAPPYYLQCFDSTTSFGWVYARQEGATQLAWFATPSLGPTSNGGDILSLPQTGAIPPGQSRTYGVVIAHQPYASVSAASYYTGIGTDTTAGSIRTNGDGTRYLNPSMSFPQCPAGWNWLPAWLDPVSSVWYVGSPSPLVQKLGAATVWTDINTDAFKRANWIPYQGPYEPDGVTMSPLATPRGTVTGMHKECFFVAAGSSLQGPAYRKQALYFSVPGHPRQMRLDDWLPFEGEPLALVSRGDYAEFWTTAKLYVIGGNPRYFEILEQKVGALPVAAKSVVGTAAGTFFAAMDGIYLYQNGALRCVSKGALDTLFSYMNPNIDMTRLTAAAGDGLYVVASASTWWQDGYLLLVYDWTIDQISRCWVENYPVGFRWSKDQNALVCKTSSDNYFKMFRSTGQVDYKINLPDTTGRYQHHAGPSWLQVDGPAWIEYDYEVDGRTLQSGRISTSLENTMTRFLGRRGKKHRVTLRGTMLPTEALRGWTLG